MVIRGGRVVDPANDMDAVADVYVEHGIVKAVGAVEDIAEARTIDARDLVVAPGLVDAHVHLREPGFPGKETITTGTAAAAAGGFTTIFCMPNTDPTLDTVRVLDDLRGRINRDASIRVHPIAAITLGREGKHPVDFDVLAAAGAVGFSDDGDTTADSSVMRDALLASARLNRPIMVHCEDKWLASGSMHEGTVSRRLNLSGIPAEAEEIVIARDLMLARLTGGWLHVCHVTTQRGLEMIRLAKLDGVRVTAEVTPHHLLMSEDWIAGVRTLHNVREAEAPCDAPANSNTKVNPPLRPVRDTEALVDGLAAGALDIVATDHAPHAASEKENASFDRAAFGLSGLEFALPLMLSLVRAGRLSLSELVTRLSWRPSQLWQLPSGTLAVGAPADVIVFDPNERWRVDPSSLRTKSHNTPLMGSELRGRTKLVLVAGRDVHAS